jgi:glutathione peroxidase
MEAETMTIYDFHLTDTEGKKVPLSQYKGKTVLIINSATECGFTPQYADLQTIYSKYADKGFVILDFPCDQFGHQAPGSDEEIHQFCTSRFGVTFPMFHKIEVNGSNAAPLFTYLKSIKGFGGFAKEHPLSAKLDQKLSKVDPDYASKPDIKWNFTKFLIDKNGTVRERFEPTTDMKEVEKKIAAVL